MAEATRNDIVDIAFRLPGGRLPVDHAYALFRGISDALSWFADEPGARLHQVHTAASGSGWIRPESATGKELHLSRRTKLTLRVPERRVDDTLALAGRELDVGGYSLTPCTGKVMHLRPASTLLARHVVCGENEDESRFVPRLAETLRELGVHGATLVCGRSHQIITPESVLQTRSVVVTNLNPDGAMALMRRGIGPAGKLGCGIFIPYKRIE